MPDPARSLERAHPNLHIVAHRLAAHKLALMRDPACSSSRFRNLAREIGIILAYEAAEDLEIVPGADAGQSDGAEPRNKVVIVPILRSGLPLADGATELLPFAHLGHMGFRRLEDFSVEAHLIVLPDPRNRCFILMDTEIGTGQTIVAALGILTGNGVAQRDIAVCAILVTPLGINTIFAEYPDVKIHTLSLEEGLDAAGGVVPGFGHDAQFKMFGIK